MTGIEPSENGISDFKGLKNIRAMELMPSNKIVDQLNWASICQVHLGKGYH